MNLFNIANKIAVELINDALSQSVPQKSVGNIGKFVSQWDKEWVCIGPLKTAELASYNHCVGLYRHVIEGKTMYVGRAVELYNGGFMETSNLFPWSFSLGGFLFIYFCRWSNDYFSGVFQFMLWRL